MAFSAFGDPIFGLSDGAVATRTGAGTYGSLVDVMSIQVASSTLRIQSGELTGDDRITAVAARALAGQLQIRFGGALLEVLEVITGVASASSLTSPNRVRRLRIPGGQRMPAFGFVGQGLAEEGLGDQLVFVPNCKVTSDIQITMNEFGNFQVVEFTAMAVADSVYGIINVIPRETTGAFTIPPANIGTL